MITRCLNHLIASLAWLMKNAFGGDDGDEAVADMNEVVPVASSVL